MKPKILVVDDDVDSWKLLSTVLQHHNFYAVRAADGMQAIGAVRLHEPQAILLDLGLPGGDGFLILERLKSNRLLSHIPVIVVSARARQEAEEKARMLGAAAYVEKPLKLEEFIAILQSVLAAPDVVLPGMTR
jgi:DNA-binding response OmpR family regulator